MQVRKRVAACAVAIFSAATCTSRTITAQAISQGISQIDRVRLAESRAVIKSVSDSLWPGWKLTPMPLLLVSGTSEYLLWHPRPTTDFRRVGYDSLLATAVYVRVRKFAEDQMATLPAVGNVPTIVIGTAEKTHKRSTAWVLTVVHEHFHQWQYSRPNVTFRVDSLNRAFGDASGGWMLTYPFPYHVAAPNLAYSVFAQAVRAAAVDSIGNHRAEIVDARMKLRGTLQRRDYHYLSFQLWQEGIARYTEYAMGKLAGEYFTPSHAFEQLRDYDPFALVASRLRRDILVEEEATLDKQQRTAFYPVGAALGMWFDRANPTWRTQYVRNMFVIDSLFSPPRAR